MSTISNGKDTMPSDSSTQSGLRKHLRHSCKPLRSFFHDVKGLFHGKNHDDQEQADKQRNKLRTKRRTPKTPDFRKTRSSTISNTFSTDKVFCNEGLPAVHTDQQLPAIDCTDFSEEVEEQFEQSWASIELDSSFESQSPSQTSTQVVHPLHEEESLTTPHRSLLSEDSGDGGVKLPSSSDSSELQASPVLPASALSQGSAATSVSTEPSPFADEHNYDKRDECVGRIQYEASRLQVAELLGPNNLTSIELPPAVTNLRRTGFVAVESDGNLEPLTGNAPSGLPARVFDEPGHVDGHNESRPSDHATNGSNESPPSNQLNNYAHQASNKGLCYVPTHVSRDSVNSERSYTYRSLDQASHISNVSPTLSIHDHPINAVVGRHSNSNQPSSTAPAPHTFDFVSEFPVHVESDSGSSNFTSPAPYRPSEFVFESAVHSIQSSADINIASPLSDEDIEEAHDDPFLSNQAPDTTEWHRQYWGPTFQRKAVTELILRLLNKNGLDLTEADVQLSSGFYGSFNRVFLISVRDRQYALRIASHGRDRWTAEDTQALMAEVSTMALIEVHTNVPVPQVIDFDTTTNNELGATFTLLSLLPGLQAGRQWYDVGTLPSGITLEYRRSAVIRSLAGACAKLRVLEFDSMGAIHPSFEDGDYTVGSFTCTLYDEDLSSPTYLIARDQLAIGPFKCIEKYRYEAFGNATIENGPCDPVQKVLSIALRCVEAACNAHESQPPVVPNGGPIERTEKFALGHPDFNWQNLLTDDHGNITGFLDWDGATTVPIWAGWASLPIWLRQDWAADYEYPGADDAISPVELLQHRAYYKQCLNEAMPRGNDFLLWVNEKSPFLSALWKALGDEHHAEDFAKKVLRQHMPILDGTTCMGLLEAGDRSIEDLLRFNVFSFLMEN